MENHMEEMKTPGLPCPPQIPALEHEAWHNLHWHTFERQVARLQKHIYRASQRGDTETVHQLQQKLMEADAARLLAVRHVTQDDHGKDTAGVDGVKSLTSRERLTMASAIHPSHWNQQHPRPVLRV